jgi:hypothetical protein
VQRRAFAEFYAYRASRIYRTFARADVRARDAVLAFGSSLESGTTMSRFAGICAALAVAFAVPAAADDAVAPATFDGSWTAAAPIGATPPAGSASAAPGTGAQPQRGGSHGGHGGMGGGGMGGGHGGGGGHHRGADAASSPVAGASDAEQNDPGLRRLFAAHLTITKLQHPDRMRLDDGVHPVELTLDGMNVSGPAVGGTVALSATSPELVVDTVTTSGYTVQERYQLADDGTHLELHASLKKPGASDAREITRVFDRGAAKTAGATPAG